METPQKPLELILARNLLTSISTPSFLVDGEGTLVFYNEAAAAVLGRSFEEAGQMSVAQWTEAFGPFSKDGDPLDFDEVACEGGPRRASGPRQLPGAPATPSSRSRPRRSRSWPPRRAARGDDHVLAPCG